MLIERSNLLSMMKLSIKVLIQSSLSLGRTLDSEYPPLQQFFVVLEHCLKHGLKAKKSFIGQNKSIWGPLELVEKLCPESVNVATSARDLPGIKYVLLNHSPASLYGKSLTLIRFLAIFLSGLAWGERGLGFI